MVGFNEPFHESVVFLGAFHDFLVNQVIITMFYGDQGHIAIEIQGDEEGQVILMILRVCV